MSWGNWRPELHVPNDWGANLSTPVGAISGIANIAADQPSYEVNVGEFSMPLDVPEVCTLILTRRNLQFVDLPGIPLGRILARVTYGVGAANDEILIDWTQGSSITIPTADTHSVKVNAVQTGPYVNGGPSAAIEWRIQLSAMLARGSRASQGSPSLTYLVPNVTLLGGDRIPVPNRAKRLLVLPPLGANSFVQADVIATGSIFASRWYCSKPADAALRTVGVFLPGNSTSVLLTVEAGHDPETNVTVLFLLDG